MRKFTNIFALACWVILLIFGIVASCGVTTIHPISFICADIVCILHYVENLCREE